MGNAFATLSKTPAVLIKFTCEKRRWSQQSLTCDFVHMKTYVKTPAVTHHLRPPHVKSPVIYLECMNPDDLWFQAVHSLGQKVVWSQDHHTLGHTCSQADHSKIIVGFFVCYHIWFRLWSAWVGTRDIYITMGKYYDQMVNGQKNVPPVSSPGTALQDTSIHQ